MKTLREIKDWLQGISLPVYVCCMFLGLSSWLDISGLWVELPLLVNELPEGWNLPSYLIISMQVGQLGPLLFMVLNRCLPNKVKEWPVVFLIIGIGAISCLLLAFVWHKTTIVAGKPHSTALMTLATTLSIVDATSSVVFLGYMSIFIPQYMSGYYIGDGLSSMIPGLVGLGQGVGGEPDCVNTSSVFYNETTGENVTVWRVVPEYQDPNFSPQTFFLMLFAMLSASCIAFAILHFAPFVKGEYRRYVEVPQSTADIDQMRKEENDVVMLRNTPVGTGPLCARDEDGRDHSKPALTPRQLAGIVILTWWNFFVGIGCHKSLESYATLPYGDRAYNLSVRLSTIADPLACLLALFMPKVSVHKLIGLTFCGTVLFIYQLILAIHSPHPPLQGQLVGEILAVGSAILMVFTLIYTRVVIAIYLQSRGGRRALLWNGAIGQFGVFCGAIITFLLINVYSMLTRSFPCRQ